MMNSMLITPQSGPIHWHWQNLRQQPTGTRQTIIQLVMASIPEATVLNAAMPLNFHTHTAKIDFNLSENHQLNVRGNFQWDTYAFDASQFPDTPGIDMWSHPAGVAANYTWTVSPTLVNTFRYGFYPSCLHPGR